MDERGMDTVFGALILILACMVASAFLLSFPYSEPRNSSEIDRLEAEFDCILYSTIDVSYSESGISTWKSLSISTYLIDTPTDSSMLQSTGLEESASTEISKIIDFFMSRHDGWVLQITWDRNCTKEIASRNRGAVGDSNVYVLERSVPDLEHESRNMRLLVAG